MERQSLRPSGLVEIASMGPAPSASPTAKSGLRRGVLSVPRNPGMEFDVRSFCGGLIQEDASVWRPGVGNAGDHGSLSRHGVIEDFRSTLGVTAVEVTFGLIHVDVSACRRVARVTGRGVDHG